MDEIAKLNKNQKFFNMTREEMAKDFAELKVED